MVQQVTNRSQTKLDNIFVNFNVVYSGILKTSLSDHFAQKIKAETVTTQKERQKIRRNLSEDRLKETEDTVSNVYWITHKTVTSA